ncbi:MAG: hypothetical protein GY752_08940 [bacterium]|nr:hypothetical protein [bacterium]
MYDTICGLHDSTEPVEISNEMAKLPSGDSKQLPTAETLSDGLKEGTSLTKPMRTERRAYNNQW